MPEVIKKEREAKVNSMTPEERERYDRVTKNYERLFKALDEDYYEEKEERKEEDDDDDDDENLEDVNFVEMYPSLIILVLTELGD